MHNRHGILPWHFAVAGECIVYTVRAQGAKLRSGLNAARVMQVQSLLGASEFDDEIKLVWCSCIGFMLRVSVSALRASRARL